ncbi:MAG: hypothetical protein IJF40_06105 [Clostridia bacterium]|nr:hypothetical protein [Clostridia bacterium]
MKQIKKITSLLMVALLIFMLSATATAFAHEVPDLSRKGSITVAIKDGDKRLTGGSLTLYKVGNVTEDNGDFIFVLTDEFRASGISLENLESEQLAKDLAEYADDSGAYSNTEDIDSEGRLVYKDLDVGLYLLVQKEAAEGYLPVNPFLVSVPMVQDGAYLYDVYATPKVDDPEKIPDTTEDSSEGTTGDSVEESTDGSVEGTTSGSGSQTGKPQLPLTGQLNWPVPVLVMLGLALILVGFTLRFGKKKGNQS